MTKSHHFPFNSYSLSLILRLKKRYTEEKKFRRNVYILPINVIVNYGKISVTHIFKTALLYH